MSAIAVVGQTTVSGVVTDAETKEPLPFVNVFYEGTTVGSVTDADGAYVIHTPNLENVNLHFSFLGYKTIIRKIRPGETQELNVKMAPDAKVLDEVTVTSGNQRERYRNKNNPAVDLVREMISHKRENRMESYNYAEYEEYEKLQMSLSNMSDKFKDRKIFRKYKWLFENVDTTTIPGKALLPIYLQETLSDR